MGLQSEPFGAEELAKLRTRLESCRGPTKILFTFQGVWQLRSHLLCRLQRPSCSTCLQDWRPSLSTKAHPSGLLPRSQINPDSLSMCTAVFVSLFVNHQVGNPVIREKRGTAALENPQIVVSECEEMPRSIPGGSPELHGQIGSHQSPLSETSIGITSTTMTTNSGVALNWNGAFGGTSSREKRETAATESLTAIRTVGRVFELQFLLKCVRQDHFGGVIGCWPQVLRMPLPLDLSFAVCSSLEFSTHVNRRPPSTVVWVY